VSHTFETDELPEQVLE
jgi:hypothetical protein